MSHVLCRRRPFGFRCTGGGRGFHFQAGKFAPIFAAIDRHFGPIFGNRIKPYCRWHWVRCHKAYSGLCAGIVDKQGEYHLVTRNYRHFTWRVQSRFFSPACITLGPLNLHFATQAYRRGGRLLRQRRCWVNQVSTRNYRRCQRQSSGRLRKNPFHDLSCLIWSDSDLRKQLSGRLWRTDG